MTFDAAAFRRILSHYPTGVCAITSVGEAGPVALIVGSFTSVSLDPPLVGFLPARASTTWPKIAATGRFCVNVLGAEQRDLCRLIAAKGNDPFAHIAHRASSAGLPIIDGCVAWIDCDLHAVLDAGDHLIVLGLVHSLDAAHDGPPLLFLRGSYSAADAASGNSSTGSRSEAFGAAASVAISALPKPGGT